MDFTPLRPSLPPATPAATPAGPGAAAAKVVATVQAANEQTVAQLADTVLSEAARSAALLSQATSGAATAPSASVPVASGNATPAASLAAVLANNNAAATVAASQAAPMPAVPAPTNAPGTGSAPVTAAVAGASLAGNTSDAPVTPVLAGNNTNLAQQAAGAANLTRGAPKPGTPAPDVYHGTELPAAPNLLAQKGVGAYIQLLNVLAGSELHEKSADLLTTSLQNASAALKLAYYSALSRLPTPLAQKAWGFSISNGSLIFTGEEAQGLSPLELTALRNAFGAANVESSARQVAAVITSIEQMRKNGGDSGSLAWAHFNVDETNFGSVVDLRNFVTESAPGSHYHPSESILETPSQVPPMLGGMDLREMLTTRPRFLRADGTVNPEALEDLDLPAVTPDVATLHGRCSCGQVQFIAQDRFEYAFYCHCSRCRARTGSAFAAIAGVPIEHIEVVAGHEHLLLEGECSDGYGARCGRCYAFLFAAVRGRKYLHVSLGILTDTPSKIPDHHIHVGSKAPWFHITDGLPQYLELP